LSGLPLGLLLLIFAAAAAVIWVAGIELSKQTDVLSTRLHLGAAESRSRPWSSSRSTPSGCGGTTR
jgi:hypothetical protein